MVPDPPLALGIPVTWVLPPSYTTSNLLPVTDSYGLDVHSHRKGVIYSVLRTCESKKKSITIHGGKVRTRDIDDLACIQGNDLTTQRTEIASCVRVAQVSYLSIVSNDFFLPYHFVNTIDGIFYFCIFWLLMLFSIISWFSYFLYSFIVMY